MSINKPIYVSEWWGIMGISPRSRWSNRDESSFRGGEPPKKRKLQIHNWGRTKGEYSAAIMLIGQIASLASLAMLYAGTRGLEPHTPSPSQSWSLGGPALMVTIVSGLTSFLLLFRVAISRKAPKRRRRLARLWLIASIIIGFVIT